MDLRAVTCESELLDTSESSVPACCAMQLCAHMCQPKELRIAHETQNEFSFLLF